MRLIPEDIASFATSLLFEVGAVKIDIENPFKLANGMLSPIYIDMRVCLGNPPILDTLISLARLHLELYEDLPNPRNLVIAGVETAGAIFAKELATRLNVPFVGVRKEEKTHGSGKMFLGFDLTRSEAALSSPREVILVDDTTTDGKSKIPAIKAILETGSTIAFCFTFMDRQQGAADRIKEYCKYSCLMTMDEVMEILFKSNFIAHHAVSEYIVDPKLWNEERMKK